MTKVDNNIISSKLFMLIPTDFSLSRRELSGRRWWWRDEREL
jgi:hypothetical protein